MKFNRTPLSALLALAVVVAIIAAACEDNEGSSPDPFAANLWSLSDREARIGSVDDPDYIFNPILRMALGPDGLLYTAHEGEGTIRRWTADGNPAGSLGKKGEDPGEFEYPYGVGFFGDSLWVWDGRFPTTSVPLADERFDSVVQAWAGPSTSEAQIGEALYRPPYLPAVSHVIGAEDGTIWLQRFDPVELETGERMNEWWVLDAGGAPLARARAPVGLDVRLITHDMVWQPAEEIPTAFGRRCIRAGRLRSPFHDVMVALHYVM